MLHQNLIARPSLAKKQKEQALLELGQDYLKAGLLDRAERLFLDLKQSKFYSTEALKYLIEVYQQEKDWHQAISIAREYERATNTDQRLVIAQYYCELAEKALEQGDKSSVGKFLKKAISVDPDCVRASIAYARLYMLSENYSAAIKELLKVPKQNESFVSLVIDPLILCYEKVGASGNKITNILADLIKPHHFSASMFHSQSSSVAEKKENALRYVENHLSNQPTLNILNRYVELLSDSVDQKCNTKMTRVKEALARLVDERPDYHCDQCGFAARSFYWQCPSCKTWASIKPI
jgi:lipopolysaccharide biosynthesis regulator YciM